LNLYIASYIQIALKKPVAHHPIHEICSGAVDYFMRQRMRKCYREHLESRRSGLRNAGNDVADAGKGHSVPSFVVDFGPSRDDRLHSATIARTSHRSGRRTCHDKSQAIGDDDFDEDPIRRIVFTAVWFD
jgi:hypothetical protein